MNQQFFTQSRLRETKLSEKTALAEAPALDAAAEAAKRERMARIKNAMSASARQRRREALR